MISDRVVEYPVTNREEIFDGYVLGLRRDDFDYQGQSLKREYVTHPGAVGVIALNHEGAILLVEQYRHAQGKIMWEPPAGLLDTADEDPLEAIKRELHEETGYVASKWNVLVDYANTPGGSSEQIRVYFAQGLALHKDGRPPGSGEEELDMPVHWVQVSEVLESIAKGLVTNSVLVTGTYALLTALAEPDAMLRPADSPWPAREELLKNGRVRLPKDSR
jgi:ADP-ribose pyrophosphatase